MVLASFALQMAFYMGMYIMQMAGMMYWLSGTRTEKIMPGDARTVTLDDYKGQPVVLERARYLVRVLEGWGRIREMGGEPPKGVLLVGGPGTGKTYLAQCLAGEAKVPFALLDASGLVSMFFGMGAMKVRRFFSYAKKMARRFGAFVMVLDELDSIGTARGGVEGQAGGGFGGGGFWGGMGGMGVLNTLLTCMDGLEGPSGIEGWFKKKYYGWLGEPLPKPDYTILVMGSTNRGSVLDAALTRAGRFDMQLRVTPPTTAGLKEVIEYYLGQVRHAEEIDTYRVASALRGATPADVKTAIRRNAVVYAERANRDHVIEEDIYQGAWEAVLGIETPPAEPHARDQRSVAMHEAGHAIALAALFPEQRVLLATIIPHAGTGRFSGALGMVIHGLREERQSLPVDYLARGVMVSMAGREAAALLGRPERGFLGDRRNIQGELLTLIAEGYFGYEASLLLDFGTSPLTSMPKEAKEAIAKFLDNAAKMTRQILQRNQEALDAMTELLLREGTVTAETIEKFFREHSVTPPPSLSWLFTQEEENK